MARFDFTGGSYTLSTINADNQRSLNLYPEIVESGDGRSKMTLLNTPGLAVLAQLDAAPRQQLEFNGMLYVVGGVNFYQINLMSLPVAGTPIIPAVVSTTILNVGLPLSNDGLPASIAANENQLLISSAGNVYIYYLNKMNDSVTGLPVAAGTFLQVPASNFTLSTGNAPVKQVAFCDSFFLALIANSQSVQISNVLDGFNWIPGGLIVGGVYTGGVSSQIVVSVYPENVVGMVVDHRNLWLIGRKASVAYSSGDPINIFDVQPGSYIEQGAIATFAISKLDNSPFWVSGDDKGDGIGFRLNGLTPQRITTHAVELAWRSYPKRSDAVSYAYQDGGHAFWCVLFPSANRGNGSMWVYDVATSLWHERDLLNETSGASLGHPSWNHAYWNGFHVVGDWRSANLYQMDVGLLDNAGIPIIRTRRAPHISTELEITRFDKFTLDVETGVSAAGQASVYMQSPNGSIWRIGVNDQGLLTTTATVMPTAAPQTIKLNNSALSATWQVGISNAGLLTTTSISLDVTQPVTFLLVSATRGSIWNMGVTTAGLLQTTRASGAVPTVILNNGQGPLVWLRWSDDGGHTWSSPQSRPMGAPGQWKTRCIWWRLGAARVRTLEISCSEAVPFRIVDGYVNAAPGYQPSERLTRQYQKVA